MARKKWFAKLVNIVISHGFAATDRLAPFVLKAGNVKVANFLRS
jgi:hypothetical protein